MLTGSTALALERDILKGEIERLRKVLERIVSKEWNDQVQIKEYAQRMLEK